MAQGYWPRPSVTILAQSAVQLVSPADTNENTAFMLTIPAGRMGANGGLRVTLKITATSNANTKTIRAYLASTVLGTHQTSSYVTYPWQIAIYNRGAQNSQVGHNSSANSYGSSSTSYTTGTVDMSVDQVFKITFQKATGTDTLTIDSYTVELLSV